MELAEIADHLELAPLLGHWHVTEWGQLYRGWTVDVATAEFRSMDVPGRIPTTWVAFDGPGRAPGDVLGSISLLADDDLEGFGHLGPWLASLYVVPRARGRGIGRRLVSQVVEGARALGVERLHLFTAGQEDWYRPLGWRTVSRISVHGHPAAVMVLDTHPLAPRRAIVSTWSSDPDVATAYSYLRPGGEPADRDLLTRPLARGLHLAGEVTWSGHPGTMHGAWWSGERAAATVLAELAGPGGTVVVVGAGLAGLAAARALAAAGRHEVVVLEASGRPGGRTRVDRSLGGPVHLGASWVHGEVGNPVAELADRTGVPHEAAGWGTSATYVLDRGRLPEAEADRLGAVYGRIGRAVAACARVAPPAGVLGPVARALVEEASGSATDAVVLGAWLRAEYQGLYAAPLDDLSLAHCAEPYRLPGDDRLLTGPLDVMVAALVDGLDVRCGTRVTAIEQVDVDAVAGPRWRVRSSGGTFVAEAVVVTVPVGVLKAGGIRFEPPLPSAVVGALDRIGAGVVAKAFLSFDEAFWKPDRSFWVAGEPAAEIELWVDVSGLAGRPTLCGFATGASARVVEAMDEDGLCALGWRILTRAGVIP